MVGGVCGVRGDVIPFGLVNGQYASLEGLNIIGMKRRKFTRERLAKVRSFYQKLFHGPGSFAERLSAVQPLAAEDPAIAEILTFIDDGKHRALCLPADARNDIEDGVAESHDIRGFGDFIAGRLDRGGRRDAVRGRGFPDRTRYRSRCFCAERRLRSGGRGTFSPSLDFGRPARQGGKAVSRRTLPRSGFHRHAGAAGAFRDPARLGYASRHRPRHGRRSGAATIICCPASAASSNRTVSGWWGSRMSPRIC